MKFAPVATLADLDSLSEDEVLARYATTDIRMADRMLAFDKHFASLNWAELFEILNGGAGHELEKRAADR